MYLENSEQSAASVEGEQSAEVMLTEQCQFPKETVGEDFPSPSKRSAEAIKEEYNEQTVDSGEIKTSIFCVEDGSIDEEETESMCCDGHFESFEQFSTSDGFCESDQIVDQCEAAGLSQPFDECTQHCECFKPCESSEHSANHSLTSECSPCCEHSTEHLQLFEQCKPSHQQYNSETYEVAVNFDSFGQCEKNDFILECSDQQDEFFDNEPDTSTEDSEQLVLTAFAHTTSDSEDSFDCDPELCMYDETQYQSECTDDEASNPSEQNEAEPFEEEFGRITSHFDDPDHVYLDESEDVSAAMENSHVPNISTDHCKECEIHSEIEQTEYETTQQCDTSEHSSSSERTSDFFSEEDGSSDCSSIETKSFKTCLDGSIPSEPCSDSSEESDKGAQEDSSDEQTQWESFEDDDEIEQSNTNALNEDRKKTPTTNIVIEDYFDLFDKADYYGHTFPQKRHYISCFDGGDIHARLYLEEINSESQKLVKNTYNCKEISEEMCLHDASDKACENTDEDNLSDDTPSESREQEKQRNDWIIESELNLAEDIVESEEVEKDENVCDEESCTFYSHDSETYDGKNADSSQAPGHGEKMCAPFANDISVEGDAYEDEVSDQNNQSCCGNTSTLDGFQSTFLDSIKENMEESEDNDFFACSEMEPYWSLANHDKNEELGEEPCVEEYYAYQIKSIQSSLKQALDAFMKKDCSYNQIWDGKANDDASWSKVEGPLLSLKDNESQAHDQSGPVYCSVEERDNQQHTLELSNDCGSSEISEEINPPSSIIHSVVSEYVRTEEGDDLNKASEQSRDSEDEQSDDESCECEYCIPSIEQVLNVFVSHVKLGWNDSSGMPNNLMTKSDGSK